MAPPTIEKENVRPLEGTEGLPAAKRAKTTSKTSKTVHPPSGAKAAYYELLGLIKYTKVAAVEPRTEAYKPKVELIIREFNKKFGDQVGAPLTEEAFKRALSRIIERGGNHKSSYGKHPPSLPALNKYENAEMQIHAQWFMSKKAAENPLNFEWSGDRPQNARETFQIGNKDWFQRRSAFYERGVWALIKSGNCTPAAALRMVRAVGSTLPKFIPDMMLGYTSDNKPKKKRKSRHQDYFGMFD